MFGVTESQLKRLRIQFPEGTRVECVCMPDDPRPIEPGTRGTVQFVDDVGDIHVAWDNGRGLALVPGVDHFKIV